MPDIAEIIIKNICFFPEINQTKKIPQCVKQSIQGEFYYQLKKASKLFGKPRFSRNVTIYLTPNARCFNSKDSYIAFQEYCINWTKNEPKWNLQEALSHEIVHLIVGNAPMQSYRNPPFVMEEGMAYYNTQELGYAHYSDTCILNAINCINDALQEVPNLLTTWRSPNGEAPVIQMLNDDDLQGWGLGAERSKRLLTDFK